jgi:hypothetical protein
MESSIPDVLVYPARLKMVKSAGIPVRVESDAPGAPLIALQWQVCCGHPSCRRVFGTLQRLSSRFARYQFLLDGMFVRDQVEPDIWRIGRKISRSVTPRPRRAQ